MTALLCPVFQEPQLTSNNEFLAGGLLWFYEAGSSTLAESYTDQGGNIPWTNPIVLDSRGESGGTIWLDPLLSYRIVLESKPYYGQVHGVVITEHDDITGIPVIESAQEWITFPDAPTYISSSSFSVLGDYRSIFTAYRKLRLYDNAGETIHSVTSSSFGSGTTTVNITGSIDVGLSRVDYSFVSPDASPDTFDTVSISQNLTVDGNATIDGNVTIGGNLNSIPIADYWNDTNNTFGISVSPNNGYAIFANGLRLYRETKAITFVSSGATIYVSSSDTYSSPFPNHCFQVIATLGDVGVVFGQNSPILSVRDVTTSGFNYDIICKAAVTVAGTYNLTLNYLAIGY